MPRTLTSERISLIRRLIVEGGPDVRLREFAADALGSALDSPGVQYHSSARLHPLGFLCLPIFRTPLGGLCLHAWTSSLPRPMITTTLIHAHSWDLTSYVVSGAILHEEIEIHENGDEPNYRLCVIRSADDVDEITPTLRLVDATMAARRAVPAGSVYRLAAGRFHTTSVIGDAAITLVDSAIRFRQPDYALSGLDAGYHRSTRRPASAADLALSAELLVSTD